MLLILIALALVVFDSLVQPFADISRSVLSLESDVAAACPELDGFRAESCQQLDLLRDVGHREELRLGLESTRDRLAELLQRHDLLGLHHELLRHHLVDLAQGLDLSLTRRGQLRRLVVLLPFLIRKSLLLNQLERLERDA